MNKANTRGGSRAGLSTPFLYCIYGYVGLCMAIYGCVGRCIYGYVWLCMAVYGCVWLCRAVYGCVCLCSCMYARIDLSVQITRDVS